MLEKLSDFLCGSEWLAFESDFGLDETVRRLAAETKRPLEGFQPLWSQQVLVVVGEVSEQKVSLWCERLFVRNGFRPEFLGWFQLVGKRVILIGKLSMSPMIYAMQFFWIAVMTAWTAGALGQLMRDPSDPANWLLPLFGPVAALLGVAMARVAKWLSSGDEGWILAAINSALYKTPLRPTS
jgi:hypothetical protein